MFSKNEILNWVSGIGVARAFKIPSSAQLQDFYFMHLHNSFALPLYFKVTILPIMRVTSRIYLFRKFSEQDFHNKILETRFLKHIKCITANTL